MFKKLLQIIVLISATHSFANNGSEIACYCTQSEADEIMRSFPGVTLSIVLYQSSVLHRQIDRMVPGTFLGFMTLFFCRSDTARFVGFAGTTYFLTQITSLIYEELQQSPMTPNEIKKLIRQKLISLGKI